MEKTRVFNPTRGDSGLIGYMKNSFKFLVFICMILATLAVAVQAYDRPCASVDLCGWNVTLPLGSEDNYSCGLSYNTYWPLNTSTSATCTFNGSLYPYNNLYVSINNDIINCTLNGVVVFENQQHEGCAPVDPMDGYNISINATPGTNTLVCNMQDRGGMDHFDSCVVGSGECTTDDDCNYLDDECADGVCNLGTHLCEQTFEPDTTVCRASAGVCDLAETCTGSSADCPADAMAPLSTPCEADVDFCTVDHCDGQGNCVYLQPYDCSNWNLPDIATCTYSPDDNSNTWDYAPAVQGICNETSDSCEYGVQIPSHTCADGDNQDSVVIYNTVTQTCSAECDGAGVECQPHIDGNTCYYDGSCNLGPTCNCSYDITPMGCNDFCNSSSGPQDTLGPLTSNVAVTPWFNGGMFDINATVNDNCSNIKTAEYFLGWMDGAHCGATGTGTTIPALDGSFDEKVEDVLAENVEYAVHDGVNWVCVRGQDTNNNWGNCECLYFQVDIVIPEEPVNIKLDNELNPDEYLICGNNPVLSAKVCDLQSYIQGGEYFIDAQIPPLPNPWTGLWMNSSVSWEEGFYWCANVTALVNVTQLEDGTHRIVLRGKDDKENWGKLSGNISFIKDTTAPVTSKVVDSPKVACQVTNDGDGNLIEQCWYIQQGTEIELVAFDPDPQQTEEFAGLDKIMCQFRWRLTWEEEDPWEPWSTPVECPYSIVFDEDSIHEIKYWSVDKCGNVEEPHYEIDIVDTQVPVTTKVIMGPQFYNASENKTYFDGVTKINLTCVDPEPHPVDNVTIYFRYRVDEGQGYGDWTQNYVYVEPFSFLEESKHELEYWCVDALGNDEVHQFEIDYVDHTPPFTTKTYGSPYYTNGNSKWINSSTLITLTADDGSSVHSSGVRETKYSVTLVDDINCYEICSADGSGIWETYTAPFTIGEESCHLIEYYSVDNVNKTEIVKRQCVFVDNSAPIVSKDLVGPSVPTDVTYPASDQYDVNDQAYYVTQNTSVILGCSDPVPHPVDNVEIYYKYYNDGQLVQDWTLYTGAFKYGEDTYHELFYYCEDALGNKGEVHRELDIVDTQKPVSVKTLGDPKHACTLAEVSQYYAVPTMPSDGCYFINQSTSITLTCADQSPHPVDNVKLYYRYFSSDLSQSGHCVGTNSCEELDYNMCEIAGCHWELINFTEVLDDEVIIYPGEDSAHVLQWYCVDELGNTESLHEEYDIVDTEAPSIVKSIVGPSYGDCLPTELDDECFIDGITQIHVESTDPSWHPSDHVTCDWDYIVTDGTKIGTGQIGVVPPFDINFPEESTHVLTITCKDILGNEKTDVEKFIVDKTSPTTTKTYGAPLVEAVTGGYPKWITSQTQITLTVEDTGIHKSGIRETKYRVTLLGSNEPCENDELCQEQTGSGIWNDYITPFTIGQESCHLIEYYSVDNVNKTETVKKQCVYVDNTPPAGSKLIGEPKIPLDDGIVFTTSGTGTAGWSNEQSHSNENSIKMTTTTTSDQGRAKLPFSGNFGDITSFNYWSYVVNGGTEGQLAIWASFYLDENNDDIWDYYVQCEPYYTYGNPSLNTWQQYDVMNMKCQNYEIPTGISLDCPHSSPTLAQYMDGSATTMQCPGHPEWGNFASREYGSLKVIKIDMRAGYGGPWTGFVGYIDDIKLNNELYTGDSIWVRDHFTEITLDCVDPIPHPVDHEKMCYKISFDVPQTPYLTSQYCLQFGGQMENDWCCVDVSGDGKYLFTFQEDSLHDLEYYCVDALGNTNEVDLEYFKVDSTPPVTTKTIEGPTYPASQEDIDRFGLLGNDVTNFWIRDHVTNIILDATDYAEPCDVGVKEIHYRICLDNSEDNQFTEDECNPWIVVQDSHTEFMIDEDCLHKIEWYAVDLLGNTEQTHEQFHRVDSTPPVTEKTFEGPTYPGEGGPNYWLTSDTQITLTSVDHEDPCAVGVNYIHYEVWWDSDCNGEVDYPQTITDVPSDQVAFYMQGQCLHEIRWYAVDLLGNNETQHVQEHMVDDTPPHVLILKPVDGWYSDGEDMPIVAIAEDLNGRMTPCEGDCGLLGNECAVGIEDGAQCYAYLLDVLPEPQLVELETEGTFLYNAEAHECQGYATIPDPSEIPDGVVILVVRASDNLGNEAGSIAEILRSVLQSCGCDVYDMCAHECVEDVMQDVVTIWNLPKIGIDNQAPEVTITQPIEGTLFGGEQVVFSANVTDANDGDITSTITSGAPCYVSIGGVSLGTVPYNNIERECSGTIMIPEDEDFPQGTQELKVEIADNAGNIGSDSINVNVDTVVPVLSIVIPSQNQFVKGTIQITAEVSDANLDANLIKISTDNGQSWEDVWYCNPSQYCYDWNTVLETDGMAYGIIARATDAAGNIGYSEVVVVIVDNDEPEGVYVLDPVKNDVVEGTIMLKALATDYVSGVESVKIYVESIVWNCDAVWTNGVWQCEFNSTVLVDGQHEAYAIATDNMGLETTSTRVPFIIDNNPPSIPSGFMHLPDMDVPSLLYSKDNHVSWSWNPSNDTGSGVDYYLFDLCYDVCFLEEYEDCYDECEGNMSCTLECLDEECGGYPEWECEITKIADGGENVTFMSYTLADLPDGEYQARVKAVDNAGFASEWTSEDIVRIDTMAPTALSIWTEDVENEPYDTDGEYDVEWDGGFDMNFDRYDIEEDGVVYNDVSSPYSGDGSEGEHTYKVYAYDKVGRMVESEEVTVFVDTMEPEISVNSRSLWPPFGWMFEYSIEDGPKSSGIKDPVVSGGLHICSFSKDSMTGSCLVAGWVDELNISVEDMAGWSTIESVSRELDTDFNAPVVINSSPSGILGSNDVTIEVWTNEDATCKFDTETMAYEAMANTFATTGSTYHSQSLSDLENGMHVYYVRCMDDSNNQNKMLVSEVIVFAVDVGGEYGFSEELQPVWDYFFLPNLILEQLDVTDFSVENVLSSLNETGTPTYDQLWYCEDPCTSAMDWKVYYPQEHHPGMFSTLTEFNDIQGRPYWIKMLEPDTLIIEVP